MTKKELELILKKHSLWLEDNTKGERANLSRAYLYGANLNGANLSRANLYEADLYEANLSRANLKGADLKDTTLPRFQIPQDGALTVYKKLQQNCIARLLIPAKAKRTACLVGRKCRAEYVKVLSITSWDGKEKFKEQNGSRDRDLVYKVGQTINPDSYNDDTREECTNGIHFFLTRKEAEEY